MAISRMASLSWLLLISFTCILVLGCLGDPDDDKKVYIAYMGDRLQGDLSAAAVHTSILQEVVGSGATDALLYSYHKSFSGFVAKLTKQEKEKLAAMDGVVSVFPNQKKKLHTTRSWDFLGFPEDVSRSTTESEVIVAMLDTGIWPESASFNDSGYGPPPSKWKGSCVPDFPCNNKIIGAKYYRSDNQVSSKESLSPRDTEGHGTHTASTVAGGLVQQASLYGLAEGTARGGTPSARIAVYKICWSDGCSDADILAAFDDAIADGVDIISLSVGGWPLDYFNDSIAIGAFHSMKNGILTSNSAGNDGPFLGTISNCSPWSLSVAASTIDRKFLTQVMLGNGDSYEGVSINTFASGEDLYPIIYGGDAPNGTANKGNSRYCSSGSLNKTLVQGKIVLCDQISSTEGALEAGAFGTIMTDNYPNDSAFSFPISASYLDVEDGSNILKYINSTSEPKGLILKSTEQNDTSAPVVVSFSSRGPNPITSDILKPDITAPGVDILAAWSEATTVTGQKGDTRVVNYNIISGTSMSCPHASAAAAYVKSFHPAWSPAAIKSALMTTAYPMTTKNNADAELAYGSGHINPLNAIAPGLVYDAKEIDYVQFLCGQGYTKKELQLVTGDSLVCSQNLTVWDLNYPSFALSGPRGKTLTRVFHRTVTNVGPPNSTYNFFASSPVGLSVEVSPRVLFFANVGDTASYEVTATAQIGQSGETLSGSLVWSDGDTTVHSPIVAFVSGS